MSRAGHIRIRQKKNGERRYQAIVEVWKNCKKNYTSQTFSSRREAEKWYQKTRYEIEQGLVTKELLKSRRLSDAIQRYKEEVLPQKPRNAHNVSQHLDRWNKELGRMQLQEVTAKEVAECRDKLLKEQTRREKQRSPATVVRYLSSLSALFEVAIKEWHWIEKNPVRLIRKPTVSNARTRFLSKEECDRLLQACKASRNAYLYPIVSLALYTGMRRGEILGLRWQDIDFEKREITLQQTKNGSIRYVYMVERCWLLLKEIYEQETIIDLSFRVFPSLNEKYYVDIRTAFRFALKRAKISNFTFHDLRHSCASFLAMSGTSQRDIAEILGHKDLRMTYRYSHLSKDHLVEQLENAMEKFIGSGV